MKATYYMKEKLSQVVNSNVLQLDGDYLNTEEVISEVVTWMKSNLPSSVSFQYCGLNDRQLTYLSQNFSENQNLQLINLRNNDIGNDPAAIYNIFQQIFSNNTLEAVDLIGNPFSEDSVQKVCQLFLTGGRLRSLCGCWSNYPELSLVGKPRESDITLITSDLVKNKDMKSLQMDGCTSNTSLIFDALEINRTLLRAKFRKFKLTKQIVQAIDAAMRANNSLKTLELSFVINSIADINSTRLFCNLLRSIQNNKGITSLSLESFPVTPESIESLAMMIMRNSNLLHISLFNIELNQKDFETIAEALQQNHTLRLLHVSNRIEISATSHHAIDEAVLNRGYPLILRIDDSDFYFSTTFNSRNSKINRIVGSTFLSEFGAGTEDGEDLWEVGDVVEMLHDDDTVLSVTILAVSKDFKYTVQLSTGQIKSNVRMSSLRRGVDFVRNHSIPPVDSIQPNPSDRVRVVDISNDHSKNGTSKSITTQNPKSKPPAASVKPLSVVENKNGKFYPFVWKEGDVVEARFIGDPTWYPGVVHRVVEVVSGTTKRKNQIEKDFLYSMMFDDEIVEHNIESHMIRPPVSPTDDTIELKSTHYDAGIYQRGDYVEINNVITADQWKRARVAFDKRDGTYDVRTENSTDIRGVKGKDMRFHFRPKDLVEYRIQDSFQWEPAVISHQSRDGTYTVVVEGNTVQEKGVNARRIMPRGREEARKKSEEESIQELLLRWREEQRLGTPSTRRVIRDDDEDDEDDEEEEEEKGEDDQGEDEEENGEEEVEEERVIMEKASKPTHQPTKEAKSSLQHWISEWMEEAEADYEAVESPKKLYAERNGSKEKENRFQFEVEDRVEVKNHNGEMGTTTEWVSGQVFDHYWMRNTVSKVVIPKYLIRFEDGRVENGVDETNIRPVGMSSGRKMKSSKTTNPTAKQSAYTEGDRVEVYIPTKDSWLSGTVSDYMTDQDMYEVLMDSSNGHGDVHGEDGDEAERTYLSKSVTWTIPVDRLRQLVARTEKLSNFNAIELGKKMLKGDQKGTKASTKMDDKINLIPDRSNLRSYYRPASASSARESPKNSELTIIKPNSQLQPKRPNSAAGSFRRPKTSDTSSIDRGTLNEDRSNNMKYHIGMPILYSKRLNAASSKINAQYEGEVLKVRPDGNLDILIGIEDDEGNVEPIKLVNVSQTLVQPFDLPIESHSVKSIGLAKIQEKPKTSNRGIISMKESRSGRSTAEYSTMHGGVYYRQIDQTNRDGGFIPMIVYLSEDKMVDSICPLAVGTVINVVVTSQHLTFHQNVNTNRIVWMGHPHANNEISSQNSSCLMLLKPNTKVSNPISIKVSFFIELLVVCEIQIEVANQPSSRKSTKSFTMTDQLLWQTVSVPFVHSIYLIFSDSYKVEKGRSRGEVESMHDTETSRLQIIDKIVKQAKKLLPMMVITQPDNSNESVMTEEPIEKIQVLITSLVETVKKDGAVVNGLKKWSNIYKNNFHLSELMTAMKSSNDNYSKLSIISPVYSHKLIDVEGLKPNPHPGLTFYHASICPDLSYFDWILQTEANEMKLREMKARFVETLKALNSIYMQGYDVPLFSSPDKKDTANALHFYSGPKGVLLLPKLKLSKSSAKVDGDVIHESLLEAIRNIDSSSWYLYFVLDDHYLFSEDASNSIAPSSSNGKSNPSKKTSDFSHPPIVIPYNEEFFNEIKPLLLSSICFILSQMMVEDIRLGIPIPFTSAHFHNNFDMEGLIELFHFFLQRDLHLESHPSRSNPSTHAKASSKLLKVKQEYQQRATVQGEKIVQKIENYVKFFRDPAVTIPPNKQISSGKRNGKGFEVVTSDELDVISSIVMCMEQTLMVLNTRYTNLSLNRMILTVSGDVHVISTMLSMLTQLHPTWSPHCRFKYVEMDGQLYWLSNQGYQKIERFLNELSSNRFKLWHSMPSSDLDSPSHYLDILRIGYHHGMKEERDAGITGQNHSGRMDNEGHPHHNHRLLHSNGNGKGSGKEVGKVSVSQRTAPLVSDGFISTMKSDEIESGSLFSEFIHHLQEDVGIMDQAMAIHTTRCLMSNGFISWNDVIGLKFMFLITTNVKEQKESVRVNREELKRFLSEAGLTLLAAMKLSIYVESC